MSAFVPIADIHSMSSSALGLNIPEPLIGRADDRMSGVMSAIGTKADIPIVAANVRY
jgi:hypothetical protein